MAFLRKKKRRGSSSTQGLLEKDRLLFGKVASAQVRSVDRIDQLNDVEFGVFSQWGEDGILEWLISQLGDIPESFVEFGVEDYRESNTRFLLQNRNWRGLVIDGSEDNVDTIKADQICWRHDLTARHAFIDRDNINDLISGAGFTGDLGVLSVDIDGNDYWVWEAISVVTPIIVVIESNAVFGDLNALTVPYRRDFDRTLAHYSNLFFGASPKALEHLANEKGYQSLGSNSNGSNLFFVRNDFADHLLPKIARQTFHPSRVRESRDANGALSYLSGFQRTDLISQMEVVNILTGETAALGTFSPLFSEEWRRRMGEDPQK